MEFFYIVSVHLRIEYELRSIFDVDMLQWIIITLMSKSQEEVERETAKHQESLVFLTYVSICII